MELDWNELSEELDYILSINGEDVNWFFEPLTDGIPSSDVIGQYYTNEITYYLQILSISIIEEKFEISSKIKKVLEYNKKEIIKQSKIYLTPLEVEEIKDLVDFLTNIEIDMLDKTIELATNLWYK